MSSTLAAPTLAFAGRRAPVGHRSLDVDAGSVVVEDLAVLNDGPGPLLDSDAIPPAVGHLAAAHAVVEAGTQVQPRLEYTVLEGRRAAHLGGTELNCAKW